MSMYVKTQDGATSLSSNSNSIISDAYDSIKDGTRSYSVGEYFIKDNILYKVTTDYEELDPESEWTEEDIVEFVDLRTEETTVTNEISELNSNYESLSSISIYEETIEDHTSTTIGDYTVTNADIRGIAVSFENGRYKMIIAHLANGAGSSDLQGKLLYRIQRPSYDSGWLVV